MTTLPGWARLLRYAADLARTASPTPARITVADKPNVLPASGTVIRQAMELVGAEFPDVPITMANADAVAMQMVLDASQYDIVVAENLLGDVLSDLAAGLAGGLGLAPSGSFGTRTALFEPVHGSAPDIAGQGIANPMAYLLSLAMCADYLGLRTESGNSWGDEIRRAVATVSAGPVHTPDQGGTATTSDVVAAVKAQLPR